MKELEPEQFEAELRTLRPAKPPQKTLDRLLSELGSRSKQNRGPVLLQRSTRAWWILRRLIPAAAAAALVALLFAEHHNAAQIKVERQRLAASARLLLKADKVTIDRQLVADFDAVSRLPSGEPVRFRCQQWMDKVWLRDSAAGLVIERTTPRLEIVPVRFETY